MRIALRSLCTMLLTLPACATERTHSPDLEPWFDLASQVIPIVVCPNPPQNGTADRDVVNLGPGDQTFLPLDGDDKVNAGAGNDCVIDGFGADNLSGGAGNDLLGGGFGADRISGGTGDDILIGSTFSFPGTNTPFIPEESDVGDNAADRLIGGPGNDICFVDLSDGDVAAHSCEEVLTQP